MASRFVQAALKSQQAWAKTAGTAGAFWVFPGLLTAGWVLFPALDPEWKQSLGLATDPAAVVKQVQAAKVARMEAHFKAKGVALPSKTPKKEEEEDEEEEEEEELPPEEEEEDSDDSGNDDEEEDGGDGGDDEDDDEEESPPPKPLYDVVKGDNLSKDVLWDNFTIKSVRMNDEDDDDDDDDEDDE